MASSAWEFAAPLADRTQNRQLHPRVCAVSCGELAECASHVVTSEGPQRERGLVANELVGIVGQCDDTVANVGVISE